MPTNQEGAELKACPPEISDEMIEAGCEAWSKMRDAMVAREQSERPEDMPDYDEGDVCRAIFTAMDEAGQSRTGEKA